MVDNFWHFVNHLTVQWKTDRVGLIMLLNLAILSIPVTIIFMGYLLGKDITDNILNGYKWKYQDLLMIVIANIIVWIGYFLADMIFRALGWYIDWDYVLRLK